MDMPSTMFFGLVHNQVKQTFSSTPNLAPYQVLEVHDMNEVCPNMIKNNFLFFSNAASFVMWYFANFVQCSKSIYIRM